MLEIVQDRIIGDVEKNLLEPSNSVHEPSKDEIAVLKDKLLEEPEIDDGWNAFLMSKTGGMFLRAALVQQNGVMDKAEMICLGFRSFRSRYGWPFRISSQDVAIVMDSGFHILWPTRLHSRRGHPVLFYDIARLDTWLAPVAAYQKLSCFLLECLIYGDTGFTRHMSNSSSELPSSSEATVQDIRGELADVTKPDEMCTEERKFDGIVYLVLDARSFGTYDLTRFSFEDLFRGMGMLQDSFPIKPRKIFLLYSSYLLTPLINTLRWSMSERLRERIIIVDNDFQQLLDEFDPEHLPVSMGGAFDMDWPSRVRECCEYKCVIQAA